MTKWLMFLGLVVLFAFVLPKLKKTKVADGITMLVPQNWRAMDRVDFTERYPSVRAPLAAYTNEERLVDLSVNISATQWPDTNIELAKQFFKSSLLNTFDKVEIITEGIHEKHGKRFIYFEFNSRVNGKKQQEGLKDPVLRYSYIQYLIEKDRTLVFSFSCPTRQQQDWQDAARKIMTSIKVN
jgi:hypothetical protein